MKHPFDVHVGNKIRQSRSNAALSERELGEKLGIPASRVQELEDGLLPLDSQLMRQIFQALNAPASFYFEGLAGALSKASVTRAWSADGPVPIHSQQ